MGLGILFRVQGMARCLNLWGLSTIHIAKTVSGSRAMSIFPRTNPCATSSTSLSSEAYIAYIYIYTITRDPRGVFVSSTFR